jgi:hypothetical protein
VKVLSRVFRGKFVAGLRAAFHEGSLEFYGTLAPLAQPRIFAAWLRLLFRHDWIVYAKPPFGGPEHALRYLSGYTHRVAISNRRLVALEQGSVTFRWRDSAHANQQRLLTLPIDEFLRRFLLHLLPRGFVRIRNFGFLANRQRAMLLPLCLRSLQDAAEISTATASPVADYLTHSGAALSAAEPCRSSNASLRLNFCFVHHLSTSTLHEPATTASNHPRAPARTKSLRLIWPRIPCQSSLRPLPAASTPTTSRCNYRAHPPTATSQIIRTCSTIYKTHRLP